MTKPWSADLFSPEVQARLQEAARVQNSTLFPNARTRAIEKAVKNAQQKHPEMFKKENYA